MDQYMGRVVQAINEMNADIIVIPGDLIDSNIALNEKNFTSLSRLNAPAYFILGNHDIGLDVDRLFSILNKNNINILINEAVTINGITLLGLDYMSDVMIYETLNASRFANDKPLIIMHHSPIGASYIKNAGADLYIAGHTHAGGQIFPVTWIIKWFFYTYLHGLYDHDGMSVFVSSGVGTVLLPMRITTFNEIDLLILQPKALHES